MEDMSVIIPGLWLGSIRTVRALNHYRDLRSTGLTHVLTVMSYDEIADRDVEVPDCLSWTIIPIEDTRESNLYPYFKDAITLIEDVLTNGGRILVHCMGGISRSPTVVVAYIMWRLKLRLTAAIEYVRDRRDCINPNWAFYGNLVKFEEELFKQMEMGDVPNKSR